MRTQVFEKTKMCQDHSSLPQLVDRMHGRIEASSTSWVLAPKAPAADLHTSRWGHSDGPLRTMVYDGVMFDDF